MPLLHTLRSQRRTKQRPEPTQQVLVFQLRSEWFALPITRAYRVIPLGTIYGDPNHQGVSLTRYQDREITVVDVAHRIFGDPPNSSALRGRYLLILELSNQELVGIPIADPPILRRVPETAFSAIPTSYSAEGNIYCVSSLMVQSPGDPPTFILDPDRLAQTQRFAVVPQPNAYPEASHRA